ncbi:ABC transporter ATP-binding protein [Rathayibacter toxicus]|uniref:ABC transporter ATP-binding protein n=1 Tax=Rathayibacter toxicus TaxID=145458 RepID=A0A0C5BQP8_9MICO|nr:ABC transporter ATP-binding protein [Rathayibacter toxicus]AJM76972.1 histidinol phosphatase [Rathayibacter toxicus]ALS57242.1 histidinol phosphatase [Rathayibacter toxicus]KKM47235.1 histidinol phosphatase [Rathayibacter toxicus]PPG24036.1 ABC transporter ATP-binding protein [Rathayibacter toxicus]PPG48074.1 ABC transporter ATP-binding protein [Rathayibacter toxicus]
MTLAANRVSWRRGGRLVVDGVSVRPRPGSTVGLLGPNGSGKSSLLRLLQGIARPEAGVVTLDGVPLASLHRREIARAVATVTQQAETEADLVVRDVVRLGRTPHRTLWGGDSAGDLQAIDQAIDQVGLSAKADHFWHTLSGGERQRVHIARALAQEPRELLLDEPTNHLDIRHQLELLALVRSLPVTTIVALHDLNLAALFCDELLVLREGRVVAGGSAQEALTPALIAEVYGVMARVVTDEKTRRPHVFFDPGAEA